VSRFMMFPGEVLRPLFFIVVRQLRTVAFISVGKSIESSHFEFIFGFMQRAWACVWIQQRGCASGATAWSN
jgi:hypothetical protein